MAGKRKRGLSRAPNSATPARPRSVAGRVPEPVPEPQPVPEPEKKAGPAPAWMSLMQVSSTEAKNDFAGLVHRVERGSKLVVMRHDRPAVVMIPLEEYESLADVNARKLDALTARFDAELSAMNAPEVWRGTRRGFMARLDEPPPAPRKKHGARADS